VSRDVAPVNTFGYDAIGNLLSKPTSAPTLSADRLAHEDQREEAEARRTEG